MVCSPVTVRIAPPDSKPPRAAMAEQIINSTLSSPSSNTPDPCAKETVLNALKERRKRTVEEEDQILVDGQENKRRRHDSSGSGHSAFEPLVANGVPASFVPKPGTLKRGLASQSSDDHLNKRSRTSSVSSLTSTCTGGILSSSRNAITSSYSSTRGLAQLRKRSGPTSSPFSSRASSRSQTPERPAKKTREEEVCHHASSSTPLVTDKESQGERVAETTACKQQNSWMSPSPPGSSGRRKRKIQLLPCRRGDRLTLPPPPELGYSVTVEDLDLEKKASLQWFNKVLEDKANAASNLVTESPATTQPSFTFSPPAVVPTAVLTAVPTAVPATSPASLPVPGTNPLLESLKKMQSPLNSPSSSEPAGVAASLAPTSPKTHSLLAPLASLSGPLPLSAADTKPTATLLASAPAVSTAPVTDTKPPPTPQAETPAKVPAPLAPAPKQSSPFEMLSPPPSSPATPAAAPSLSSASPMFKPIFEPPSKVQSEGPLPSSTSLTAAATSSTATPTTSSTTTPTFKPIFGSMGQPPSMPLAAPFFKPTTAPVTTAATASPLFPPLATATSTVASITIASTSTDSTLKLPFSFGVNSVANTLSSTTSTTASTSQPFLFGASPAPTSSFTPAVTSIFQFNKSSALPVTTAISSFGQSLSSAPQTATTSSSSNNSTAGFSGFGSAQTALAPVTTSQSTLTFSHTTTPAFNIPFGSASKPPVPPPPYPGANPQPTFGATDGQQQGSAVPALPPNFGSSFTFGNSAAPAPAQPAFGSSVQSAFGSLKAPASTFGTPASTQPAFGSGTAVFSFGAATTSSFGAITQTTSSGTSGTVFSSAPSLFTFGAPGATTGSSGGFGLGVAAPGTSSTSGAFTFGAAQSGTTGTNTPFGGALTQSNLGAASQSTPFAFNAASAAESKPVFGGTSTPNFGQSAPTPGVGTVGSTLSFGTPSTPAQSFMGVAPFGSATPSFSIGSGSKTPGARQRLQARRQHTRKK